MQVPSARHWIEQLKMTTHVEGGSFVEVYRSAIVLDESTLSAAASVTSSIPSTPAPVFNGPRNCSTHIYFLLEQGQFSAFHRIASDELWHFYEGDPLTVYELLVDGTLVEHLLGRGPGYRFFTMIHAGSWFASKPLLGAGYSLVGCTVSPGFDFADFELADAGELIRAYPMHEALITSLCR